jgi:histidinol-phosphate aminotransferase
LIDLSANESPYNHSNGILKHTNNCFENINRYLEYKELDKLVKEISDYCETEKNRIIIGSGTDKLFQKVILNFFKNRDLVILNPNFYKSVNLAKDLGMKIRRVQLKTPTFHINWKSMKIKDSIIIIDYPNNPTGQFLIKREELEELLNNNNIVIIDEAGYEYSKETFIDLVDKYKNLIITRTFDKAFGLAGLKISYMVMGNNILEKIDKAVDINRPAFVGALEALKNKDYIKECISKTLNERNFVKDNLIDLGLKVYESEANFLLVKANILDLALQLGKKEILIEDLSQFWLDGYYRISIGNSEENKKLIDEIKVILKN